MKWKCFLSFLIACGVPALCDDAFPTRAEAYRTLMQYPAPWGLRNRVVEAMLADGKGTEEAERYLDLRSHAAELLSRTDYLLRANRLLKCGLPTGKLEQTLSTLKDDGLQPDRLDEIERNLDSFQFQLETKAGGAVCLEYGTDIFTWIKAWPLLGHISDGEASEPVPWKILWGDGAEIRLLERGAKMDLRSSWTTSVYDSPKMTVTFSVLSPLYTIDLKTNLFRISTRNLRLNEVKPSGGYFTLKSKKAICLFVTTAPFRSVRMDKEKLTVAFEKPTTVGLVRISHEVESNLPALVTFYHQLLARQPIECVQVQRGNQVEQIFEYRNRASDWAADPKPIAPVPHLLLLSQQSASRRKAKCAEPIRAAADSYRYVEDADRLHYELPEYRRRQDAGINVWPGSAGLPLYKELRDDGCRSIRLACGPGLESWDWAKCEEYKKTIQRNLQWIREAGNLKVGIDLHNEWFVPGLSGVKGFSDPEILREFIRRWAAIIEWCRPYRDIVEWYDLMNEPLIFCERESVKPYAAFMRKAIGTLRPLAGDTPLLIEAVNMANSVGLNYWEDVGDPNIIVGYHDYWPHMFTHQRVVEQGDPVGPAVFYPSFMPMIEWGKPSWRNDNTNWYYWDRWKCNAISLPVYQKMIENDYAVDCGEYGVVGYAGSSAKRSGRLWLRHAFQRFRRMGVSHHVWATDGGFTWNVPVCKEEVIRQWKLLQP